MEDVVAEHGLAPHDVIGLSPEEPALLTRYLHWSLAEQWRIIPDLADHGLIRPANPAAVRYLARLHPDERLPGLGHRVLWRLGVRRVPRA